MLFVQETENGTEGQLALIARVKEGGVLLELAKSLPKTFILNFFAQLVKENAIFLLTQNSPFAHLAAAKEAWVLLVQLMLLMCTTKVLV